MALTSELRARPVVVPNNPNNPENSESEIPEIKFSNQPLYLSEEQEDVEWQYKNDLIDLKTYEALMKELDFENSEVQLADEYAYENYHY